MTSFFLFLSDVFVWTFQFFEAFGNVINWILFLVSCALFIYWCWVLVAPLGGDKDKAYTLSKTDGKRPYYDPELYNKNKD